jgi:hypothetical protein
MALASTPEPHDPLWGRIKAHPIGGTAAAAFARRLAAENMWSLAHAEAVIGEYRRFCYLACTHGSEITPSDAVDQAWHLHLTHSRDYWEAFCPTVLGCALHHAPGSGSPADAARFRRQYDATLARYAAVFGHAPSAAIWPSPDERFQPAPIRIDGRQFLLVRKLSLPGRLLRWFARPRPT